MNFSDCFFRDINHRYRDIQRICQEPEMKENWRDLRSSIHTHRVNASTTETDCGLITLRSYSKQIHHILFKGYEQEPQYSITDDESVLSQIYILTFSQRNVPYRPSSTFPNSFNFELDFKGLLEWKTRFSFHVLNKRVLLCK